MAPVVETPELVVKAPKGLTTECEPLHMYMSNDTRDVLKTTVRNHNVYYLCASRMKAAIKYINQIEK